MANITTVTSNPMGRWWHPLPLTSGIGLMMGTIVMKLTNMIDFSWWFVILFPIISDIVVNLLIMGLLAFGSWVSDKRENRRKSKNDNQ